MTFFLYFFFFSLLCVCYVCLLCVFVYPYVCFSVLWAQLPELNDMYVCIGLEHELDAGIAAANESKLAYFVCFVRHIEGIWYHLNDPLAPNYVDVIEVNNTRAIERDRTMRLAQMKVRKAPFTTVIKVKTY